MSAFRSKEINYEQQDVMNHAAALVENLAQYLEDRIKDGRYKSLAMTNLETAMMYVNKAIAHDGVK